MFTASTSPIPFSGENWFDPLEDAVRFRIRAFIEALVEEEAQAALGDRGRYQRNGPPKGYSNGHRRRQLVGTFGALTVSLPRARLFDGGGGEKEWRSQTPPGLQAADQTGREDHRQHLSGRHQYASCPPGANQPTSSARHCSTLLYKVNASTSARMRGRLVLNSTTEIRGSFGDISGTHVSLATAIWLQTMVPLTAGDTVELQGYFRAQDGYFAADHTSFWGAKVG